MFNYFSFTLRARDSEAQLVPENDDSFPRVDRDMAIGFSTFNFLEATLSDRLQFSFPFLFVWHSCLPFLLYQVTFTQNVLLAFQDLFYL